MSIVRGTLSVLCLFLISNYTFAQAPTIQDCLGAIPVCQDIYFETNAPIGNGTVTESTSFDGCVPLEENSIWYTFTVNQSGDFGFLITPNNLEDDYDWALFDITTSSCSSVINSSDLVVSCNNAGSAPADVNNCNGPTGATGDTNFNSIGGGCFPPNSPFNDFVPVTVGNIYALYIVNWTGSQFGYEIDFSLGNAGIYDQISPIADSPTTNYICEASGTGFSQIELEFNENIQCSTIGDGNFSITGPGGPYTFDISSIECALGADYTQNFLVNISPPLENGNFTFDMTGTPSLQILDICDNPSEPFSMTFNYDACSLGDVLTTDCDDGNPGTIYDTQTVLECDQNIVCLPCAGICGAFFDSSIELCEGDTVVLNTGEQVWQAGDYQTNLTDVNGCDSIIRNFVTELPSIGLEVTPNFYGFFDDVNVINTTVSVPNVSYSWSPPDELSCTDCPDPEILSAEFYENTYNLTVVDQDTGCEDMRTVNVFITDYNEIFIPNAFSPNGDGQNDVVNINFTGFLQSLQFAIYNRYGEMVFYTEDTNETWDGLHNGRAQPIGVFGYVLQANFPNDVTIVDKGNITLIK